MGIAKVDYSFTKLNTYFFDFIVVQFGFNYNFLVSFDIIL